MFNITFANCLDPQNTKAYTAKPLNISSSQINSGIKKTVLLNKRFEFDELLTTNIPASDRSLNYGDGTFTTMYYHLDLGICLFNEHLDRLEKACSLLHIKYDKEFIKQLIFSIIEQFLTSTDHQSSKQAYIIKILITRGSGGRGYAPPKDPHPLIIVSLYECNEYTIPSKLEAISCCIADIQLSHQPVLAGLKHTSRLEQVLAKHELQILPFDELLLTDKDGLIIEATAANVFLLKDDCWLTPELDLCGVKGVMRDALLSYMSSQGITSKITRVHIDDLQSCDAAFACNALNPVIPINTIQSSKLNVDVNLNTSYSVNLAIDFTEWLNRENFFNLESTKS